MNDENLLAEFNVEKPAKKKKAKRLENLNEQIDTKPKGSRLLKFISPKYSIQSHDKSHHPNK